VLFGASLLLLLLLAAASTRLPALRGHLTDARTSLTEAQSSLRDGDTAAAMNHVVQADREARDAQGITVGVLWRASRAVPGLGLPFRELTAITDATRVTTSQVAVPLARTATTPPRWTGRLDATPLVKAQAPLAHAEEALARARRTVRTAPRSRIGPLESARDELTASLAKLAGTVHEARVAADVIPALAGNDHPRHYFVALQNPAEQRATGGLIGAFAVLSADHGKLTLEQVGSDNDLTDPAKPVIDLGPEFDRRYGRLGATAGWRSANLTPHIPSAGKILAALWANRTGQRVDGVIFLDPAALGLVLKATGPVRLTDGTRLTSNNATTLLERNVYKRFPRAKDAQRNDYLQDAVRKVFARLSQPGINARVLLAQGGKAVGNGHLRIWTSDERLEARLVTSTAGGALPGTTPYLRVVTQDVGGSKLDVYLRQDVRYAAKPTGESADLGHGPQPEEAGTVRITLRNTAPAAGLPEYVTLRADPPDGKPRPVGQLKSWVSVYLGPGATLIEATQDGRSVPMASDTEQRHAVFSTYVSLDPGATTTLVLRVRQPIGPPRRP
jgi:hypothetical protein